MAELDWGDGVCHVYGHKTPDSDAACSSLAYAALMRELGYDCEAFVCYSEERLGRKNAFVPTIEKILGKN